MAADLSIHVAENITEDDLRAFFSNTLGSKYFNPRSGPRNDRQRAAWESVSSSPSVWIGEVSWLKAALFEEPKTFIPDTVGQIYQIIGEDLPVIDDDLIRKVMAAFDSKNATTYDLANPSEVKEFLESHKGKRAFTVSW